MDDRSRPVIRCEARGFPFDLHCDAELHGTVSELFRALERRSGRPRAVFSVGRVGGPGTLWHVRLDGQLMMACEQLGEALHGLIAHITQRVMTARDDLLSVHAAAVATPAGAVLLPGSSGSGKTTLCARLLQQGAAYLSDDSVALDRNGRVLGYPKPLAFKAGTWEHFADRTLADLDLGPQLVWQVPPSRLGAASLTSAEVVAVAVPRFEPHAALRIERLPPHAAAEALLEQTQNLLSFGVRAALEIVGPLAARIPAHTVVYGDGREAAPAVLELIGAAEALAAPFEVVPAAAPPDPALGAFPVGDLSALCFEDGALLVRAGSGQFAAVDRTGAVIWPSLDGHRTVASISAELAPRFGARPAEIEADIARFIDELVERGFLLTP